MTERYEKLTRADLHARLRAELEALQESAETDAERLAHELSVYQLELEIKNRDLHAASQHVQDARDTLEEASEGAAAVNLQLDADGRILQMEGAAARLLGDSTEQLAGRPLAILVHEADRWKLARHLKLVCAGQQRNAIELRLVHADGRLVRASLDSRAITGANDLGKFCESRLVDITRQRHAEAEARRHISAISRAARFNALGEMASGIAHELSQPLSAIVAYVRAGQHLLQAHGAGAVTELEQSLDKVAQQAERASEIIRRIRGFVHKEPPRLERHSVGALLQHALAVVDDDIQEADIAVHIEESDPETRVWVDAIFIEQVMVNLLRNAIESIVAARKSAREIGIRISHENAEWVEVSLTDNGEGLAQGDPEQWFMPFATSRRGSLGLGLSLSRSLVEAHGGHLWAEPLSAGGAKLRFTMPTEPAE